MKRASKRRKSGDDEDGLVAQPNAVSRQLESRSDSEPDINRNQLKPGNYINEKGKDSDVVLLQPEFGTLGRLPREILLYIMSFLETPKYIRTTTVSRSWRIAFWEGCVNFTSGNKSKRLTNAQIGAIIPMFSSQRLLSFRVGKNESLNSSLALLAHITGLKHLDLRKVEVADAPMKKILRGCRALTYLNLSETLIRDDAAEEIAKLKNLTYLDCSFDGLIRQGETLSDIVSRVSNLRVLRWIRHDSWSLEFQSILPELSAIGGLQELAMNELVNTDMKANVASLKHLKVLELHHFEVRSADAFSFLGDLPQLEALQIVSINKVKPQNYDNVNDDWFPEMVPFPVASVPNLRLLELDSPSIHFKLYPNNMEELFDLTKLQVLAIRPNAMIADYISLEKLTRLTELQVLDLSPNSTSKRSQALSVQVVGLDTNALDGSKIQMANLSYTRIAAPQNLTRLKVRKSSGGAHTPGSLVLAEQAFPSCWFQWYVFREAWINKHIHDLPV